MNSTVIEMDRPEVVEISRCHRSLIVCEFDGKRTEGDVDSGQSGGAPIANHGVNQEISFHGRTVCDLGPEVMCMRLSSIVTVQFGRDHGREQFPLESC